MYYFVTVRRQIYLSRRDDNRWEPNYTPASWAQDVLGNIEQLFLPLFPRMPGASSILPPPRGSGGLLVPLS